MSNLRDKIRTDIEAIGEDRFILIGFGLYILYIPLAEMKLFPLALSVGFINLLFLSIGLYLAIRRLFRS